MFDSWVRKIHWRRARLPTPGFLGFSCGSAGKDSACNTGDLGLIPGLGRSPGEGKGHPLQDSGLENSMDCIVHGVAKSQTQLSDFHFASLGSSVGKESACNAGDPVLIPGLGRSPGEGIGYPLQYSWASLVAQVVKNLPTMWETWVPSLSWEDTLEEELSTHFRILVWRIPMDRGGWWSTVHGVTKSWTE